jgi:hypothetical protein
MSDHNAVGKVPGIVPSLRLRVYQKMSGKSNATAYTSGMVAVLDVAISF